MGPVASVYLRTELGESVLLGTDSLLRSVASKIETTRKGRCFHLWIDAESGDRGRPFCLEIWETQERLYDCQEDLHELGLSSSDVPTYIAISAGCNQPQDWQILRYLVELVAVKLNGIATEPVK